MCLLTNQQKPTIIRKDLIVYKILSYDLKPVFFSSEAYILGKLNKTIIRKSDDTTPFDSHDIKILEKKLGYLNHDTYYSLTEKGINILGQGFHSCKSIKRCHREDIRDCIFECTIPKGSEVYRNPSGLLISNKIIINKMVFEPVNYTI